VSKRELFTEIPDLTEDYRTANMPLTVGEPHMRRYAGVALTGAIVIWLVNTLASIVRGTGNMRVPSLILLAASAVQIALGGGLGLGIGPIPRFGLVGVASGLVIGSTLGAAALLWFLRSGRARITLRLRGVALRREMFLDILRVGALARGSRGQVEHVRSAFAHPSIPPPFGNAALE
jgi:Na+-driven multidrug efflux pump